MIHIAIAYIVTGTAILFAIYLRQRYQSELKSINSSLKTQLNRAEHLSSLLDDSVQNNSVFKRFIQDLRSENNRLQSLLKDKDADIAARDKDIESFAIEVADLRGQVTRLENEKEQARQDVKSSPVKRTRAVKK
jgi:chromosome segregation ATPase